MRYAVTLLTLALAFAAGAGVAQQKYFKVTDQYGNVTYTDQPPPEDTGVDAEPVPFDGGQPDEPVDLPDRGAEIAAAAAARPLVLFTVPKCDTCDFVRWYLDDRGLPFEELNVEGNIENQMRLKEATGEYRVPVLMVGETPLFGYDGDSLAAELENAGYLESAPEAPAIEEQPGLLDEQPPLAGGETGAGQSPDE